MKILHVITSLHTGGAEKLMVDLLPILSKYGNELELAIFDGRKTPFFKQLSAQGIPIHALSSNSGKVYNPLHIFKLIRLIRKGKYDIVHTHNTAPQLFAAIGSMLFDATLCTTEHNTSNRRRSWKWFAPFDRWMYNRYDKVICISQKAEENLRTHLQTTDNRILTINNGVDVARFTSAHASPALEALAPESKKIIMVAGFRWEKDQDTVIKALRHMPDNFHLFLAGDGIRRKELENLAASEALGNRVHFLGIRSDIPELLHAADYIVMSSHFEGLSLSSVEGMSVGKPFIASDVDGLREVVTGAGVLFPHQDAQSLANAILQLDSDENKYKSIADSCLTRAKQFDISAMADAYNECYKTLEL